MALGILSCLLYLLAIRRTVLHNDIDMVEWDKNTTLIDDYSVELLINEDGYRDWFQNVFHGADGDYDRQISPGLSLKRHIIESVEE